MNCPSCRSELDRQTYQGTEVDLCRICRGLWLDHGEIDQLLALRAFPEALLETKLDHTPAARIPEGHRTCPRCNTFLTLVEVDKIRLDVCAQCKGFFCDRGEFSKLDQAAERRSQHG